MVLYTGLGGPGEPGWTVGMDEGERQQADRQTAFRSLAFPGRAEETLPTAPAAIDGANASVKATNVDPPPPTSHRLSACPGTFCRYYLVPVSTGLPSLVLWDPIGIRVTLGPAHIL